MAIAKASPWQAALKTLSDEDRKLLTDANSDHVGILKEVLRNAEAKKAQCMQKRWKFKRKNGEEIILRDVFEKMVNWVNKFKEIGDAVVNYDPVHAALPWAGVKLVLQLATGDVQIFSARSENLEKVLKLISQYKIFEVIYLDSSPQPTNHTGSNEYSSLIDSLRDSLGVLYAAILRLLSKTCKYYSDNVAIRSIKSVTHVNTSDIDRQMGDIAEARDGVEEIAKLLRKYDADAQHQKLDSMLETFKKPFIRMADQLTDLQDDLNRQRRKEISRWLSEGRYNMHHSNAQCDLVVGTGKWLFEESKFVEWRNSSSSSVFWLHGIPGAGKTRVISSFIETVKRESLEEDSNSLDGVKTKRVSAPIAFFYCRRNSSGKDVTNPEEVFRALLKQICFKDLDSPIVGVLKKEYQRRENVGEEDIRLTAEEAVAVILQFLEEDPVTLVIDAVDECKSQDFHKIMGFLLKIVQKSASVVKILVSSRYEQDYRFSSLGFPQVGMSDNENGTDIQKYVEIKLEEAIREGNLLNGKDIPLQLRDEIQTKLVKKSRGMFLWVFLQLDNLCDSSRIGHVDDLRNELGRLPEELKDVYKDIHDRIKNAAKMTQTVAEMTIRWLLCSCRNMSTTEFIAAVSIDVDSPRSLSDTTHIKQACRGLVIQDKETGCFQFCHLSVREYFEELEEYHFAQTNLTGAIACLDTLNTYHNVNNTQPKGLYEYASVYWVAHYQRLPVETRHNALRSKVRRFLGSRKQPSSTFVQWTEYLLNLGSSQVQDPANEKQESENTKTNHENLDEEDEDEYVPEGTHALRYSLWRNLQEIHSAPPTTLFLLSTFGLTEIMRDLNKDDIFDFNAKNSEGNSALHLSVQRVHRSTVDLLLTNGALPNPEDCTGRTPLSYAVDYRCYTISKQLLEYRANPDFRNSPHSSPLLQVSKSEEKLFVKLLLDYGADPDFCTDSRGWSPLRWAVEANNYGITELLLNKKAKMELEDEAGWTALLSAAQNQYSNIVQLLLQRGANPDACDWNGWTPLARAAERGDLTIIRILLENGAKVDPVDSKRRTPLMWAARQGHVELVRALLGKGADPRKTDKDRYTVTQQARISRNVVIIRELAEKEKILAGALS